MKGLKKITAAILAGAMTLAMSVSAFATVGISPEEQKILDTAKAKAIELGVDVDTSAKYKEYVSQATTYLVKNELSQEQADAMVKAVDDAATTAVAEMQTKGVAKLSDLSAEDFTQLFDKVGTQVTTAAKAVGIVVKQTADGGYAVEDVKTGDTKKADTYVQTNSVIKQTGAEVADVEMSVATVDTTADMTGTAMIGVLFAGAVVVCGVVAKKKNLFSSVEA